MVTIRLCLAWLVGATLACVYAGSTAAGPTGGTVVGGSATIQGAGTSSVTINQSSPRAIINWNTFNIGNGETTRFNQPSSSSIALNRVVGGLGPTQILGTLMANGQVFVINGDGVLIGPNAVVNTAGFLASTNDIRNEDFMAGKYNFGIPGAPNASVVNLGTITAASGGFAALVAPGVRNSGTITATLGTVSLAAGNAFTLDFYGDKLITLAVNDQIASKVIDVATGQPLKALVGNDGKLSANGGRVELTAAAARAVVDSVINNTGVIEANSIGTKNGMIVLGAATGTSKPAGAPTQTVKLSGKISAAGKVKGTTGGTVVVTGESIALVGAQIDASGQAGGGKVLIGGDTGGGNPSPTAATIELAKLESFAIPTATSVTVDAASTINAASTGQGNGGKVILWSDQQTTFAGTILAQGGPLGGNGGFLETSSHGQVNFDGAQVNTLAPVGTTGNWLVDPTDLTIDSTAAATISSNLANSSVTLQTFASAPPSGPAGTTGNTNPAGAGDIVVLAPITWSSNRTLTLNAYHDININAAISAASGGLTLSAGNAINPGAAVNVAAFVLQNGSWSQVSTTLPAFSATDFRLQGGTFLRALGGGSGNPYQLTDIYGLQGIGGGAGLLNKSFVLANNIDASGTANWNAGAGFSPIGTSGSPFAGSLNGAGFAVDKLAINSTAANVGLFGAIGTGGSVSNLGLTNASIGYSGSSSAQAGSLAGTNNGTISNAYFTGKVSSSALGVYNIGGLVGTNYGSITGASAAGTVSVNINSANTADDIATVTAGGLVGWNEGAISNSSASGAVSFNITGLRSAIDVDTTAGGLAGINRGTITSSFATAAVSISGANLVSDLVAGGLVGANYNSISNAYATGPVSMNVTGVIPTDDSGSSVGGLVGYNNGTIGNTYATGAVTASISGADGTISAAVGALVGYNDSSVTQSYWNTTTTGAMPGFGSNIGTSSATGGLTTTLLTAALPTGFVPTVWGFNANLNNGLPILLWQNIITVEADPLTKVYGNGDPTLAYTVLYGNTGSATFSGAIARAPGENVGIYDIGQGTLSLAGFQLNFVDSSLTITPRPITVAANPQSMPYGQAVPTLTYVLGGAGLASGDSLTGALATTATSTSNVGQYIITQGTLAASSNYALTYVGANLSIGQAALTVTANPQSMVYGSAPPALTYAVAGLMNGDTLTGSLANIATSTSGVGQYPITQGMLTASPNYALTFGPSVLTVTPAPLTITANNASKTYDGQAFNGGNGVTYSGFVNNETAAVLGGSIAYGGSAQGAVNAGSYQIAASGQSAQNYAITYQPGTLTVNQASLTIAANSVSKAYDGVAFTGGNGVSYSGFVNGETAAVLNGAIAYVGNAQGAVNVGSYQIIASGQSAQNYAITYQPGTLAIGQALLTIAANDQSKVYGTALNLGTSAFTVTGLLSNGASINAVTLTSAGASATANVAGSPYAIVASNAQGTGLSNYAINYVNGGLTVTPAPLTVTANAQTSIYGIATPPLTFVVGGAGLMNGDTLSGALATLAGLTSPVGQYAIAQGTLVASPNYALNYVGANLTINPRPLTVTADAQSKIYGNANPLFTYTVGGMGLVNGDNLAGALATTAGTASGVGQYAITQGTLGASPNYALSFVGGNLTVSPRPLTVAADPASRVYGDPNPPFAFVVAGSLVSGDALSGSLATPATSTSNVGQYPITQGTLANPNYAITYTAANLTIAPRPVTVLANPATVILGTSDPSLTFGVGGAGLVNGDALSGSLTTAIPPGTVGQFPITEGTLGNPNYAISYVPATVTVIPPSIGFFQQTTQNLVAPGVINLVSLTPGDVVNTQGLNQPVTPPLPRLSPPAGPGGLPPQFGSRFFVVPPPGETRFVQNEVVLQIPTNFSAEQLRAIMARFDLTILGSQNFALLGVTTYHMHIGNGSSVGAVIQALAAYQIAGAQANYTYVLTQDLAQDPDLAGRTQEGDAAQYSLGKLGVIDIHRLLKGDNVTIAIIDSQIDIHHPDLDGVIVEQFDAVGAPDQPHAHGTGMAGAIGAHRRLMGIAPSARLYAVHAFSSGAASSESTTFNILKGLDWAASKDVRVINMSFAGPRDPSLERALKSAHDKGIVLIAAAGNAGPKSPPLYPGADPNVIAVTATDSNDKLFPGANRGRYIAVAAPGVDVLVPAPDGTYQLTTGTSVASAEVSGVAALLIERNPALTPDDVRKILLSSARRLGTKERDDDFGSGLVDPTKAIQTAGDFSSAVITGSTPRPGTDPKRSR